MAKGSLVFGLSDNLDFQALAGALGPGKAGAFFDLICTLGQFGDDCGFYFIAPLTLPLLDASCR